MLSSYGSRSPHPKPEVLHKSKTCNGRISKKKKVRIVYINVDSEDSSSISGRSESPRFQSSGSGSEDDYSSYSSSCYSEEEPPDKRQRKRSTMKTNKEGADNSKSDEEEYIVEKIVDMRFDTAKKQNLYLVKWANYDSAENTWEPEENMVNCKDIVKDYLNQNKKKSSGRGNKKRKYRTLRTTKARSATRVKRTLRAKTVGGDKKVCVGEEGNETLVSASKSINADTIKTMHDAVKKVVDVPFMAIPSSTTSEADTEIVRFSSQQQVLISRTAPVLPTAANLFYFRVIIDDGQISWIYVDTNEPAPNPDELYRCVVTEDLTGKEPKLIYGWTASINGDKFCLVQFEGFSYVEVIPPENLFAKFPSFRKFYEVHCPQLFSS